MEHLEVPSGSQASRLKVCMLRIPRSTIVLFAIVTCLCVGGLIWRLQRKPEEYREPDIAVRSLEIPEEMEARLFAHEPSVINPVAISLDDAGRLYVVETFRFRQGMPDHRSDEYLVDDDLKTKTVEDRLELLKKWSFKREGGLSSLSRNDDRLRRLEDKNGDGIADEVTIFAKGFDGPLQGVAAGVLAHKDKVFFACVPDLWQLGDHDGDGLAEHRTSLAYGFGVRVGFKGHVLHGLTLGPDGKIYFTMGDRGFHVTTQESQTLHQPDTGGVFRCNPDGSNLELIFQGLRNPQELAFDRYGNLFAADNGTIADTSRIVHVVEGGDAGWRMPHQCLPKDYAFGPWQLERLHDVPHAGQPAWIIPPIARVAQGPSGMAYNPGIGLPPRYDNYFFLCDYQYTRFKSGIRAFRIDPKGASFEVKDDHTFIGNVLATDLEFGHDGSIYITDWVSNAPETKAGRVFVIQHPQWTSAPPAQTAKNLVREGFDHRDNEELISLLNHADMRIRMRSQFALAERGESMVPLLREVVATSTQQLARIHAIWCFSMMARSKSDLVEPLIEFLNDGDPQVRAQVAKVLGNNGCQAATSPLRDSLRDTDARVRYHTAMSLGKLHDKAAISGLIQLLADNDNKDVCLRHAAVFALHRIGQPNLLMAYADDPRQAVRLGILLTFRRFQHDAISQFLDDPLPELVLEAARAICDVPIPAALPDLANRMNVVAASKDPRWKDTLIERTALATAGHGVRSRRRWLNDWWSGGDRWKESFLRRSINAHFRLGTADNAMALAEFAANSENLVRMRAEALLALSDWTVPSEFDRVLGTHRPLTPRDGYVVSEVMTPYRNAFMDDSDQIVRSAFMKVVAQFDNLANQVNVFELLSDTSKTTMARIDALRLLHIKNDQNLKSALSIALSDDDPLLWNTATSIVLQQDTGHGIDLLKSALQDGSLRQQQFALRSLADLDDARSIALLKNQLEMFLSGVLRKELCLDVLEACRNKKKFASLLRTYDDSLDAMDELATFQVSLYGGDSERGHRLITSRQAECLKCHQLNGMGGTAGPDLAKVAVGDPREYLLEALIQPSAKMARGYQYVTILTERGRAVSGRLVSQDEDHLLIQPQEGPLVELDRNSVDEQLEANSPMPSFKDRLSRRQLRDVIEFLISLQQMGSTVEPQGPTID